MPFHRDRNGLYFKRNKTKGILCNRFPTLLLYISGSGVLSQPHKSSTPNSIAQIYTKFYFKGLLRDYLIADLTITIIRQGVAQLVLRSSHFLEGGQPRRVVS